MALEIALVVVALGLFAVTYWMFWAGLAGSAQLLWIKRCPDCGHLRVTTDLAKYRHTECPYCRHSWASSHLLHKRIHHNFHSEW